MEHLIELLNEYAYGEHKELYYRDGEMVEINSERVISKKFWFIQWLVENEKIEWRKVIEKEIESWLKLVRVKDFPNKVIEEDKEELLMLLSIQDNPIEFLVSILK